MRSPGERYSDEDRELVRNQAHQVSRVSYGKRAVFFACSAVASLIDVPKSASMWRRRLCTLTQQRSVLYLHDSFRYGFFFNLSLGLSHARELARPKCKSILPSSLFALVRARVNHGKQTSLFHNAAVKKSRRRGRAARIGHGARAKSVFMLKIMAARVTAFGNIAARLARKVLNSFAGGHRQDRTQSNERTAGRFIWRAAPSWLRS